jgi:hypothetical protein
VLRASRNRRTQAVKRTRLFGILVALLTTSSSSWHFTAQPSVVSGLTGSAVLDDWGNRFTSLGASVRENTLRTQVRTTIVQLAMFDAVNAVLDGPYRPFTSKPPSPAGASRREGYNILLSSRIAVQSTIHQEQDELESGDAVIAWANLAWNAISRPNEASTALSTPAVGFMQMAITQLAVYDVACALQGDYEPFSYDAPFEGQPDRNAAIATAAYRVLRTRIPGRADYLDAQYASFMALIEDNHRKTDGIAFGEAVAAHYLALRANDRLDPDGIVVDVMVRTEEQRQLPLGSAQHRAPRCCVRAQHDAGRSLLCHDIHGAGGYVPGRHERQVLLRVLAPVHGYS